MEWKFDVDCGCLLRAREGVRVRCDVMLQKELLPMLVTLRGVGEVKDACEMEKEIRWCLSMAGWWCMRCSRHRAVV